MSIPSRATAERWNSQLRCFRFCFAHGGHAKDMDLIIGSVRFAPGEAGLLDLFAKLDIQLDKITPDMPCRAVGKAYNSLDTTRYADPVTAYPDHQEPKTVSLFGIKVMLTVLGDRVVIHLAGADGDIWSVTQADFGNAQHLETLLPERGITFVDAADG